MNAYRYFTFLITYLGFSAFALGQVATDSLLDQATLENIVAYALKHQPAVQKSALDEQITRSQVNSRLSQWYPEVDFDYSLQHNFQLQTSVFAGQQFPVGTSNTSTPEFAYSQNIFSSDLVLAAITAHDTRLLASQTTTSNKIDAVVNVTKAFYDVLLTQQQIKVTDEDILRLERSVKDAQSQYRNGVVDKTDYQRATILLNNATAQKKNDAEMLKAKVVYLKSLMGYPPKAPLEVVYDSAQMEHEISFDLSEQVDYSNRIEYQMLQTQRRLKADNLKYSKIAFTPTIQGFAGYDMNYFGNTGAELYQVNYPSSFAGISLVFPIINGGRRWMNIRQAKWQLKKTDWDINDVQNNISAQYAAALANYNVNLENFNTVKSNLELSQEVYKVIQLQYRSGIKIYLDVLTAETDLRSSQINYFNALYQLLSAKIDLQKALGQLKY